MGKLKRAWKWVTDALDTHDHIRQLLALVRWIAAGGILLAGGGVTALRSWGWSILPVALTAVGLGLVMFAAVQWVRLKRAANRSAAPLHKSGSTLRRAADHRKLARKLKDLNAEGQTLSDLAPAHNPTAEFASRCEGWLSRVEAALEGWQEYSDQFASVALGHKPPWDKDLLRRRAAMLGVISQRIEKRLDSESG